MKQFALLFTALATFVAQADTLGKASLYLRDDFSRDHDSYFVEVTHKTKQKDGQTIEVVTGRSSFGNGMINLERTASGGWKGWANGLSWNLTCDSAECTSTGSSMSVNVSRTGASMDGVMNMKRVEASMASEQMEVNVPMGGSLTMNRTREGRYDARGQMTNHRIVSGDLKVEGSMVEMDPALFLILFVSPLVGE